MHTENDQRGHHNAQPYPTLSRRDPVLKKLISTIGEPNPFRFNDGGRTGEDDFSALVLHMVGQQISTQVAFTLYDRLLRRVGGRLLPARVVDLEVDGLRSIGLSGNKARYVYGLASRVEDRTLILEDLRVQSDERVLEQLTAVPGIGEWTAEMFLVFQLHRPDVMVAADIGIRTAIERCWALSSRPAPSAVRRRAATWSPFRSYACALLWSSLRIE